MTKKIAVQIVGSPVACAEGYKDTWREVAEWAASQLRNHFGDTVQVVYYDMFDPACPLLPENSQLPLVLIDNEVLINGGKISMPLIKGRLIELGAESRPKSEV